MNCYFVYFVIVCNFSLIGAFYGYIYSEILSVITEASPVNPRYIGCMSIYPTK